MSILGFGSAVFPFAPSETMNESILHAIKLGYRHFDTAAVYNSEPSLGEAIAEALRLGLVTARDELFITSKLWCSDGHPHSVLPALQTTLQLGSSGTTMPILGFGTAVFPFAPSETMNESILHAIKLGYRHFDTAAVYNAEPSLGEAIAEALRLGLVTSRDELFITSKLWCSDGHPHRVLPALQTTLQKLGLEYVDLYLIHFPVSLKPETAYEVPFNKENIVAMDFKCVWEGMEECHKLGLSKNIGVSNFSCRKLDQLLLTSKIPPMVNQVEMSPLWQQNKLRKFCEKKGIHVTAYSPLGARGTLWGTNHVLDCEVLKEIAEARGKTVAQVCLRWVYEQGVSVLVKSFNKERMKENLEIFDWTLSPEDCHKITQIPQQKGFPAIEFIWDEGPYKSLQEFWDEKI